MKQVTYSFTMSAKLVTWIPWWLICYTWHGSLLSLLVRLQLEAKSCLVPSWPFFFFRAPSLGSILPSFKIVPLRKITRSPIQAFCEYLVVSMCFGCQINTYLINRYIVIHFYDRGIISSHQLFSFMTTRFLSNHFIFKSSQLLCKSHFSTAR